jgi:hypothetical protein
LADVLCQQVHVGLILEMAVSQFGQTGRLPGEFLQQGETRLVEQMGMPGSRVEQEVLTLPTGAQQVREIAGFPGLLWVRQKVSAEI